MKSVQEDHGVRDAVKGQCSFLALQKHGDPGAGRCSDRGFTVVMPCSISSMCTPQPPRVFVAPKQAGLSATFAANTSVGDAYVDPSAASPLHLPVAGSTELALPAQDLCH